MISPRDQEVLRRHLPPAGLLEKTDGGLFLHRLEPDAMQLYLEPTSRCNLNCVTCIRHSWPDREGDMDPALFQDLLGQLQEFPRLFQVVVGGFGEPLFHPHILDFLSQLKEAGYRVKVSTNGMLLDREMARTLVDIRLDEVVISCDSLETSQFASIRQGGHLSQVHENARYLRELKARAQTNRPRMGLEFVLMEQNKEHMAHIPDFAQDLGVSSVLVTNLLPYTRELTNQVLYGRVQPWTPPGGLYWVSPDPSFVSRCTVSLPRMQLGALRCCRFVERQSLALAWDGSVSPCLPLMHSYTYYMLGREKRVTAYKLGNISRESLHDIWLKAEFVKFRHRVRLFQFPSCVDCELKDDCEYPAQNQDCWGANPSCADCLWAQDIIRCP